MALLLESTPCARCSGSGNFGPLSVANGKCFACSGAGAKLTKRGAVAQRFLDGLRYKQAAELAVGDTVLYEGIPGFTRSKWVTVDAIEGDKITCSKQDDTNAYVLHVGARGVRKDFSAVEKAAQREAALAYQATLTKAGTPRRRLAPAS